MHIYGEKIWFTVRTVVHKLPMTLTSAPNAAQKRIRAKLQKQSIQLMS
jgi:hypothetical protein